MLFSYCVISLKGKRKSRLVSVCFFFLFLKIEWRFPFFQPFITACIAERSAAAFMLTGKGAKVKR
ncbi:MAG TPA: hypothetical protein DEP43_08255 [Ruminococcaceae bacterium]|nr:hypothetical protein [Oscillospiraceae bacterium]HAO68717.1 hypothetical protein [Oscillospiraceae bacterium]HCB65930.1 hypothetical protein [Oscillospiraceae bacterium]